MTNKLPILIATFLIAFLIQSCSKNSCYECTKSGGGVTTIQNFCEGNTKAKINVNGVIDSVTMGGLTAALYSEALIQSGYSCK